MYPKIIHTPDIYAAVILKLKNSFLNGDMWFGETPRSLQTLDEDPQIAQHFLQPYTASNLGGDRSIIHDMDGNFAYI